MTVSCLLIEKNGLPSLIGDSSAHDSLTPVRSCTPLEDCTQHSDTSYDGTVVSSDRPITRLPPPCCQPRTRFLPETWTIGRPAMTHSSSFHEDNFIDEEEDVRPFSSYSLTMPSPFKMAACYYQKSLTQMKPSARLPCRPIQTCPCCLSDHLGGISLSRSNQTVHPASSQSPKGLYRANSLDAPSLRSSQGKGFRRLLSRLSGMRRTFKND